MSPSEIRRRTAEKMARPPSTKPEQPRLDGVEPEQCPKHIPATCRARLEAIRARCAAKVAQQAQPEHTVDETRLDRNPQPLPRRRSPL